MKATRILLTILFGLAITAVTAGICLAQDTAKEAGKDPNIITVQGRIEYMDMLGGYYVHGVRPGGEWMILNKNPEVLKAYMEGGKVLTIEGIRPMPERITILKIDGQEYTGAAPR